jgi:hypothetical protein
MVEIINGYGQKVYSNKFSNINGIIPVQINGKIANGLYMVHCIINGESFAKEIFINR